MRVRVLFFGVLKELVGKAEDSLDIASVNVTVGQVFAYYSERLGTLRDKHSSILFARNHEFATADTAISENDEIAFLPPVSGGSLGGHADAPAESSPNPRAPEDHHLFSITRDVLDPRALAQQVQRPEDGAVVTFEGVVRNNTKGRATLCLEYECYQELALRQMRHIGAQVSEQYALGRLGMAHRLGRLEIGEASVIVVASAPHRKPAFDAALEAINRLKREVPIWKKEFFADGEVWVDGEWDEKLVREQTR